MRISLKNIIITCISTLLVFFSVIYVSCTKDKCKGITCAYGGVCNGGSCTCPSGYEGPQCETISRLKFTGNWNVFEKGSSSLASQYPIHIEASGDNELITFVIIKNFYNKFQSPIRAYIDGYNLIIPVQHLEGKVVYGQGTIYSNTTYGQYGGLTMRYIVEDSATQIKDDFGYESTVDFSDPSQWNK